MNKVKYKELEWWVLKEDEKGKLLFLAERLRPEIIDKYFMHDLDFDVKFNYDCTNPWWKDSYIRHILNGNFLKELDINALNTMETTVEINGEKSTTKDYVRLLTKEETEKIAHEIKKTDDEYGYWTMSPHGCSSSYAYVFVVDGSNYTGYLDFWSVYNTFGVRPVIYLKSNVQLVELEEELSADENSYIHTSSGAFKGRKLDIEIVNAINDLKRLIEKNEK